MTNIQEITGVILEASKAWSAQLAREVQLDASTAVRIAKALDAAGYYKSDVCPYDCDGCHDENCPCDRLGCAGNPL